MSTLAVFGASGGTGRAVIAAARAAGIDLRCHYRSAPPDDNAPEITEIVGPLTDPIVVRETVRGADAVLVLFGQRSSTKDVFTTRATRVIVDRLSISGPKRLIVVTPALIGGHSGNISLAMRMVSRVTARSGHEEVTADRNGQERLVRASDLDWLLVKPAKLVDGPAAGGVAVGPEEPVGLNSRVARSDLAAFLITEALAPTHVRDAVYVVSKA